MSMGRAIIGFRRRSDERIDDLLTRWDLARADAASVGADLTNLFLLTTMLIQPVGVGAQELVQLLQPLSGQMARNQQQYDSLSHETPTDGSHHGKASGQHCECSDKSF